MEQNYSNLIDLFVFLLPGFVAAFYLLTSHPRLSSFERTVQALIFAIIVYAIAPLIDKQFNSEIEQSTSGPLLLVGTAIQFVVIAAFCMNKDIPHSFFRKIRLTRENSYSSEWYSAFSSHNKDYIVLH